MSDSESDSSVSFEDEGEDIEENQDGICECASCPAEMPFDEGKPVCCATIVSGRMKEEMSQKGMIKCISDLCNSASCFVCNMLFPC